MESRLQHNRFKDIVWYPKVETTVMIGGAGGIGSWFAFLIARAGFKVIINDFDKLEIHNLGGQLYPKSAINKFKVIALREIIEQYSEETIYASDAKIDENSFSHLYAVSAFDNMTARKAMYEKWKSEYHANPNAMFMDGRLEAESMQIFCVRGTDYQMMAKYEENLFDDSEIEDAPCTMKQTSHAAAMIASHMVAFFTNHMANIAENQTIRSVPFFWEYFIPGDLLTNT